MYLVDTYNTCIILCLLKHLDTGFTTYGSITAKSVECIRTEIDLASKNIFKNLNGGFGENGVINNNKKRNDMSDSDDLNSGINELYQDYWTIHAKNMNSHSPLEIAAVLLSQAMSIYRTVLDTEDYNKMIDDISDMRDKVKIITPDQGNYH